MNHIPTSPERLEQRIAPAGFVTVSFSHGLLTISGGDNADHDIAIVKTGEHSFRVDGHGTGINAIGTASKTYHGDLKSVVIEGGAASDTFGLTSLSPLKSLQFHGNAGVDALNLTKLKTRAQSTVDIDLGTGTGSVDFIGGKTTLKGAIAINLGGGGDATFRSGVTTIAGGLTVVGGIGADSLTFSGASASLSAKLTFTGGDGTDAFTSTGRSLTVLGDVSIDGGAGTDTISLAADDTVFGKALKPGSFKAANRVDLELGEGNGSITMSGATARVLGSLNLNLGTGGGSAQLDSHVFAVRDNLAVLGGAGNDTLEMNGRIRVGKMLSFTGNEGTDAMQVVGSKLVVKGLTTMDSGSGSSSFDLQPAHLSLARLLFQGGSDKDTVSIISDGTIAKTANILLGADGIGGSQTSLQSKQGVVNGLQFGGSLTIDMVGSTVDTLALANIQVAKAFNAQTGNGVSTVTIAKLNAFENVQLKTGAGADVVRIDNVIAEDLTVDTQDGADELRIERNATYTGKSKIHGNTTILTGIGADQIRIGDSADAANLAVAFTGTVLVDAGDGANMINDILAANTFMVPPTVTSTGGVLTQTPAP